MSAEDPATRREGFDARVSGIATLGEPLRRALYRYVVAQRSPVNRDQAAEGAGVARHVAKFHLDKLVDEGLLEVEFGRPPGRRGPGAGRPAKFYRRSSRELEVSLPERRYDLAGSLLARGVTNAARDGLPVSEALVQAARDTGRSLGEAARARAGPRPSLKALAAAAREVLAELGYEPRFDAGGVELANCPFHALAEDYTDLVCGMNLELIAGMLAGIGHPGLEACSRPCHGEVLRPDTGAATAEDRDSGGRGVRAYEHRAIGDAATGAAVVNLGGESADDRFLLSFGDVVALSGDFFRPDGWSMSGLENGQAVSPQADVAGRLFGLAPMAGEAGTRLDTRDEIICALKVSTVDEAVVDPRFEPQGEFADFRFSPDANRSDVERRVRDRYLALAATNDDHFVTPGRSDAVTGSGFGSALSAYHHLHQVALDEAWRLGSRGGDVSQAMAREAAAQHYLTDAFAAGHLRTPVASIRRYWKARYPSFWEHLQHKVASDTAAALRELSVLMRLLPRRFLYHRTLAELTTRTSQYPELSVGDLVARSFHDWDNTHGLAVDGGGVVFGDGHIDKGVTRELALATVRAGNNDVEVAFGLGASGTRLSGEALYGRVREATGAGGEAFVAEEGIPRLSPENPDQNWWATDVGTLWESPMVGAIGTTVGDALVAMLEPGEQFIRQVESLGQGLAGGHGVFAVPVLGGWLGEKCCQAYHAGFVEPLAHDPQRALLSLV